MVVATFPPGLSLREHKKQQQRQRILDAAWELFTARSYESVTVTEIANSAGVAPRTFYNYFPDRANLLLWPIAQFPEQLHRAVLVRGHQTPAEAVRPLIHDVIKFYTSANNGVHRQVLRQVHEGTAVRRILLEHLDQQVNAVATALAATEPLDSLVLTRAHAAALIAIVECIFEWIGEHHESSENRISLDGTLLRDVDKALEEVSRMTSKNALH